MGIKNERVHMIEQLGQEVNIVTVRQGQGGEEEDAFWNALGGDRNKVAASRPDSADDDKKASENTLLWHLKETGSGKNAVLAVR